MTSRRREMHVVNGFAGAFTAAPAHGDGHDTRVVASVIHGGHQGALGGAIGLDEENAGARRDGVGPLDIQFNFAGPALIGGRKARGGSSTGAAHTDFDETSGRRDAELLIEGDEVRGDAGVIVGVDDCNGLAGASGRDRAGLALEADAIDTVGGPKLQRSERRSWRRGVARRAYGSVSVRRMKDVGRCKN